MKAGLRLALGALIGLGLLPGCSSEPAGPTPGTLDVGLATPNGDDGAVLFTISGGPIDSLESVGYRVYSARIDQNTMRVIVIGNVSPGTIARVRIADDRQVSRYSVIINQVAAHSTYAQRDPASYSITLAQ